MIAKEKAHHQPSVQINSSSALTLNIVPVIFSRDTLRVGRLPFVDDIEYRALREKHRETHVFRLEASEGQVVNVAMIPPHEPIGTITEEPVAAHLPLLGKVLQHSILEWLRQGRTILKPSRPIIFWGGKGDALLLSRAISECGATPIPGLEVVARYSLDTRVAQTPGNPEGYYLALVIEVNTSNVIDVPLAQLIARGLNPIGYYVYPRSSAGKDWLRPKPELMGAISAIDGDQVLLIDNPGDDRVAIESIALEPSQPNLEAVVRITFPNLSDRIQRRLRELRGNYTTGNGQLALIRQTLDRLKTKHTIETADGLRLDLTDLLTPAAKLFPVDIKTDRPNLLFGPQGRNWSPYPDQGIQKWGPFNYMHNERNEPVIVVLCEAQHRGRVEQFMQALLQGFPDHLWEAAGSGSEKQDNPYRGGLTGKFRLSRISLEYEEVESPSPEAYRRAITRLLSRLPKSPELAFVQVRRSFRALHGEANPYLVAKASFMQAGVPVQAVHEETIEGDDFQLPRILNNVGLAAYAKTGGVPWVISTRNPTSHELVIGMGYTEMGSSRLGSKSRYVGITTVFQGDGRYQVWGITREVEFADYPSALLETLRSAVRYVKERNDWQGGDAVRLIFHVYKRLKFQEMQAIRELVSDLIDDSFGVKFAFLDLSRFHRYQLFDPLQPGIEYGRGQNKARRGVGVPARGTALQIGPRAALLHMTGPRELKIDYQGLPRPLLIELHQESDFDDLTYLVRQVYHFSYVSWRSFFPCAEPVTIYYSRLIANALGSLKPITNWNSSVLTMGPLRGSMWFL